MLQRKFTLLLGIPILLVVILMMYYFGKVYLFPKQYMGNLPVSFSFPATWDITDTPEEEAISLGTQANPNYISAIIRLHPYDDTDKSSVEILEDIVPHFFGFAVDYLYLTAPYRNVNWPSKIVAVQVIYSEHIPLDIMEGVPIISETQFVIIEGEQQYALMVFVTTYHIEDFREEINLIVSSFRFK